METHFDINVVTILNRISPPSITLFEKNDYFNSNTKMKMGKVLQLRTKMEAYKENVIT